MSKSLPPLTWFRSFEAAARTLSFTAAAQEIGLTQSAVSQQVRSLELRLGVSLFVRLPRGLALTDEGRKLLPQVGTALDTLVAAAEPFTAGVATGVLTVATSVSVAQWVIAPNLPDFSARHPEIRVRLISTIWPDDFNATRADVEIRFGSRKQVGRNAEPLLPNRLVAVKSLGLTGPLEALPLIETVGVSGGWDAWPFEGGAVRKPQLYADTYGMALQLARHGNGAALVSELLAGHAIKSGTLTRAHPGSVASQEGYFLYASDKLAAACNFRDWLIGLI
ncbi:MAG: LysR family transcriptional regulator [Pseudomonadota bacterium]